MILYIISSTDFLALLNLLHTLETLHYICVFSVVFLIFLYFAHILIVLYPIGIPPLFFYFLSVWYCLFLAHCILLFLNNLTSLLYILHFYLLILMRISVLFIICSMYLKIILLSFLFWSLYFTCFYYKLFGSSCVLL